METSHYHGLYLLLVAGRNLVCEPKAMDLVDIPFAGGSCSLWCVRISLTHRRKLDGR